MSQLVPCKFSANKIELTDIEIKQEVSFKEIGISESAIEDFLTAHIDLISDSDSGEKRENLMIVGQQVIDSTKGRCDLVALDGEGNLVLIEIKRDKEDIQGRSEPLEMQAIRYAAALASITTPEMLIEAMYNTYLERLGEVDQNLTPTETARRKLKQFLDSNGVGNNFNRKQRIVLAASSFDERTLAACSWLIQNGVDMTVIAISPIRITNGLDALNFERLLPLRSLSDFLLDIPTPGKAVTARLNNGTNKSGRRDLPRMAKLFEWKLIQPGDKVSIKKLPEKVATVIDSSFVEYNGAKRRFNDWAKEVTGWSAICIYEWLIVAGQEKTLAELRDERMQAEAANQPPENKS